MSCPPPPLVIPELRAGLTGPRGGHGTMPHALHDGARRPQVRREGHAAAAASATAIYQVQDELPRVGGYPLPRPI